MNFTELSTYDPVTKWECVLRYWAGEADSTGVDVGLAAKWASSVEGRAKSRLVEYLAERVRAHRRAVGYNDNVVTGKISAGSLPVSDVVLLNGFLRRGSDFFDEIAASTLQSFMHSDLGDAPDEGTSVLTAQSRIYFQAAAIQCLHYTEDPGEIPVVNTLQGIGHAFPKHVLRGAESALALFSTAYFGKQDLIHMHSEGIGNVTVIDLDKRTLEICERIYPSRWRFISSDYSVQLDRLISEQKVVDVVTADPWTGMAPQVAWEDLTRFCRIFRRFFTSLYTADMLAMLNVIGEPSARAVQEAIRERTGCPVSVADITKRRSDLYWVTVQHS